MFFILSDLDFDHGGLEGKGAETLVHMAAAGDCEEPDSNASAFADQIASMAGRCHLRTCFHYRGEHRVLFRSGQNAEAGVSRHCFNSKCDSGCSTSPPETSAETYSGTDWRVWGVVGCWNVKHMDMRCHMLPLCVRCFWSPGSNLVCSLQAVKASLFPPCFNPTFAMWHLWKLLCVCLCVARAPLPHEFGRW